MTVSDFFIHTSGSRRFSLSDCEPSLTAMEFWHKYRNKPEWNAEIHNVDFIPHTTQNDTVICLITLKRGDKQ